jgi:AhpD family alkylhydroperoxidase
MVTPAGSPPGSVIVSAHSPHASVVSAGFGGWSIPAPSASTTKLPAESPISTIPRAPTGRARIGAGEEDDRHTLYDMKHLTKFKNLGELAPGIFKTFLAFDEAAFQGGAIPHKEKELMAVAVALTTQCPYCIEIHAKKARKAGATERELAEATLVAAAVRAGSSVTHGTHTLE